MTPCLVSVNLVERFTELRKPVYSQGYWFIMKSEKKGESASCSVMSVCNPVDCGLPGSSAYKIPQARILEWVAIPFSRASSWLRDQTGFIIKGYNSGRARWERSTRARYEERMRSVNAFSEHRSPQISMCLATQKLSKPWYFEFL